MSWIRNLATFSNLLFAGTILLGVYAPQAAPYTFLLVVPAMMLILIVTLLRFPPGFFRKPRTLLPGALLGSLMNYLVFGNLIILGGLLLIRDDYLWIGLILIAAVPPAVAILPLSEKLRGNPFLTLAGFAGTHLAALILIPLIGAAFLKYTPISYAKLMVLFLSFIGLPLLVSKTAVDRDWSRFIEKHKKIITDLCFFIIFYTIAANNAQWIKEWPIDLLYLALIASIPVLWVGIVMWLVHQFYKMPLSNAFSLLLLGTVKNYGLAGGIALYVFNGKAALPALIFSIFMFVFSTIIKSMAHSETVTPEAVSDTEGDPHGDSTNN